jgi:hypothetical protein
MGRGITIDSVDFVFSMLRFSDGRWLDWQVQCYAFLAMTALTVR